MRRKEIVNIGGDVSSAVVIGIVCDGVVCPNRGVERILRSTEPTVDKLCPLGGLNRNDIAEMKGAHLDSICCLSPDICAKMERVAKDAGCVGAVQLAQ